MGSEERKVEGVGIIGAGRVSRDHAFAVQNAPGIQLVAVADPDEDRCNTFAEKYECEGYTDVDTLLAREDIDLVLARGPTWPSRLGRTRHIRCRQASSYRKADVNDRRGRPGYG